MRSMRTTTMTWNISMGRQKIAGMVMGIYTVMRRIMSIPMMKKIMNTYIVTMGSMSILIMKKIQDTAMSIVTPIIMNIEE